MIALYKGEDSIQRSQALMDQVNQWLGPLAKDPYSKEIIHVEDNSQETPPLDRFFQAAGGNSMFAEQKAIVLQGVDKLKADQLEEIISLLEQAPAETGFFFEADKLNATLRFSKTLKKLGKIHNFDTPKPWEMDKWIVARASHHKFKIQMVNAKFFLELVGPDIHKIDNEFEKIRNYAPTAQEVTHEILEEVVVSTYQGNQFEFVEFFAKRNIPKAIKSLHQIFKSGKKDTEFCIPITAALFNHYQALLITQEMSREGASPDSIAKALGKHPFLFKKSDFVGQSKLYHPQKLQANLIALHEIDGHLKSDQIKSGTQFEIAILSLL